METSIHDILQEVMKNPEISQHYGHLANYFAPQQNTTTPPVKNTQSLPLDSPAKDASKDIVQDIPKPNLSDGKDGSTVLSGKDMKPIMVQMPDVHIPAPVVDNVTVQVPEIKVPDIHVQVDAPEIPEINVHVPEIKVPDVHVPKPIINVPRQPDVNITLPKESEPKSIETITDRFGYISQIIETYDNGEVTTTKEGGKWIIKDERK